MVEPTVPKIMIAILTTYERTGWPCKELADWLANLRCNANYAWQHTFCHNFIPAAGARNTVAESFKDCGADWILMIDNDMAPPANLFDAIKNAPADAMVVVPKFFLWDETHLSLKLCWGWEEENTHHGDAETRRAEDAAGGGCAPQSKAGCAPEAKAIAKAKTKAPVDPVTGKVRIESKYYELFKCGTGAIFIRPEVFQKMPAPWFFYTYDGMKNMTATEDINFCLKLREHGMKIYGFGGLTVGHHHTVNLAALARLLYDVKEKAVSTQQSALSEKEPAPSPVADNGEVSLAPEEAISK